jgi:hypothetical protein
MICNLGGFGRYLGKSKRKEKTIKQNLIKSKNYQESIPWLQAHIYLRKSELIMETKQQFIF